jgi:hypothetical protein
MGDIKSAREIAEEKLARLGEATEEERLGWKYVPEGEGLGGRYIKEEVNLVAELQQYQGEVRKHIIEGAGDILIRNINLPRDDSAKRDNRRAMDGLKILKSDKVAVENVYSKMRRIINHYEQEGEQQRRQAYQTLKADFEAKVQQAVAQQIGSVAGFKVDVEKQPQFQEEWRRVQAQLDSQYIKLLDEYKQELRAIT